jgi:hypothetical protein
MTEAIDTSISVASVIAKKIKADYKAAEESSLKILIDSYSNTHFSAG